MSKVPCVNFGLLGEEYLVTDYIQVRNPCLRQIANGIHAKTVNEAILKAASFVCKNVRYALDRKGRPTACRHTQVFKYHGPIYLADTGEMKYGWLFPNQVLMCGYGICFDTSALCCTLLRLFDIEARVVLGAVLTSKRKRLLGFHAWVEVLDGESRLLVIETTSPRQPKFWHASDVYEGKFRFMYEPVCRFDERVWVEDFEKSKKYTELALNVLQKRKTEKK